jgi:hypothetical protein
MRRFTATPVSRVTTENEESAVRVQVTVAPLFGRAPLARRVSYRHDDARPLAPITMFEFPTKVDGSRWMIADSTRGPARV